ncbi:hypothetical protein K504DRAFT_503209 [Pleomassaria siparia CBS 279.74]|uniref:MFS general substrate transporter n=1 Tax=Pleomassaria siparia CBS 279.74 TaxID=1314801 RepID=A0A6G1K6E6_9PLEO|nr:hypothetical protein K504DRAFT_503209 [Pleomassaria siparia CBS 279.74]
MAVEDNSECEAVTITWKTWAVIFVLSSTFGLSFWPVPTIAALQSKLSIQFNDPSSVAWYIPAYTTGNAIGLLLAGANSDLFGRRLFLIFGNICCCTGFIIIATSHGASQFTAGLAITGFGGGFCQMAMCSIPELLPNKYGHIGKYIYWGGFVAQFLSLAAIFTFYKPPKHPKGIPWHEAYKGLDYVGIAIIVPGICLTLVSIIINTTYKPCSDPIVIVPMVVGFPTMVNVFYLTPITPITPRSTELLLTLPPNVGLVVGACLLIAFANLAGNWYWTLIIPWTGMTLFGALMGLCTPFNKDLMIALCCVTARKSYLPTSFTHDASPFL